MSARPRTLWGWHRLSSHWAEQLVRGAGVQPGDLVVDVGAGYGAITAALLAAGARVVAVELHPDRAAALRRAYAGQRVRVVRADATRLGWPAQPFRVVANPPFAITTAVLRSMLHAELLVSADLIVPDHVATRWSSGRGAEFARWAQRFTAAHGGRVPPSAFRPPPPSPTAVLTIRPVPGRSVPGRSVPARSRLGRSRPTRRS